MSLVQAATASGGHKAYNGWINNLLKADGINPANKPFKSYLFVVMVVMEGVETKKQEANITKFANQLKRVSMNTNAWDKFKSAFDAIGTAVNSGTKENTQGAYNAEATFFNAAANMMNTVFGKFMAAKGYSPFEANGDTLDSYTIDGMFEAIGKLSPSDLQKYFPASGPHITGIIGNLNNIRNLFCAPKHNGTVYDNPFDTWVDATDAGTNGLPKPSMLQSILDNFSEGASTIDGMGGPESTKLQMAQQVFNRLQSFVKSMLTDWVSQKKSFNGSMAQAGS